MSEKQLTDESMFTELCEKGFFVLPVYLPEKKLRVLRNAIRRIHPPWSDLPPNKNSISRAITNRKHLSLSKHKVSFSRTLF